MPLPTVQRPGAAGYQRKCRLESRQEFGFTGGGWERVPRSVQGKRRHVCVGVECGGTALRDSWGHGDKSIHGKTRRQACTLRVGTGSPWGNTLV